MTGLLVVDAETTALAVPRLTVLEFAWCVCDISGVQRTPIRSRFCAIPPPGESPTVPASARVGLRPARWTSEENGDGEALVMAVDSGLHNDWLQADQGLVVRSGVELQRLLMDDLAGFCGGGEYVHIAGAGAARFDFRILETHCPRVVPERGAKWPTHYRPVDVSIAQTGLLGGTNEAGLIRWATRTQGEHVTEIEVGSAPQYAYTRPIDILAGKAHRAPADVAQAIVVQRALWAYGAALREELGDAQ